MPREKTEPELKVKIDESGVPMTEVNIRAIAEVIVGLLLAKVEKERQAEQAAKPEEVDHERPES